MTPARRTLPHSWRPDTARSCRTIMQAAPHSLCLHSRQLRRRTPHLLPRPPTLFGWATLRMSDIRVLQECDGGKLGPVSAVSASSAIESRSCRCSEPGPPKMGCDQTEHGQPRLGPPLRPRRNVASTINHTMLHRRTAKRAVSHVMDVLRSAGLGQTRHTCMYWASKVRHSAVMADGDSPTELSRASDISGG